MGLTETNLRRDERRSRSRVEKNVLFENRTEKFEPGLEFRFRVVSLDDGRDDSDVDILRADVVSVRDLGDVDIYEKERMSRRIGGSERRTDRASVRLGSEG